MTTFSQLSLLVSMTQPLRERLTTVESDVADTERIVALIDNYVETMEHIPPSSTRSDQPPAPPPPFGNNPPAPPSHPHFTLSFHLITLLSKLMMLKGGESRNGDDDCNSIST